MPEVVAVCGGGSLAHVIAAVAGANPDFEVRVLTRRPAEWSETLRVLFEDVELRGRIAVASSDPADVIPGAHVVGLAVPSVARPEVLARIAPYVEPGQWVGSFPGFGGFDWLARSILGPGPRLFGTQRVPFVCRKLEYGHVVEVTGVRPQTFVAALPATAVTEIADLLHDLLGVAIVPMGNYLCVSLSLSNPVFHPSRIYSYFRDWHPGVTYPTPELFYEDWDERATEAFARLDAEVQAICRALPLDMAYVKPIVQHYEVPSLAALSAKIRGIRALRGRPLPLRRNGHGYVPDLSAYYFTEDIPYGAVVLRAIAEVTGVETPFLSEVVEWGGRILGLDLMREGRIAGPDAAHLPLPRHFGIDTIDELARRATE